jgi:sec-independent protein translocase protein TatA
MGLSFWHIAIVVVLFVLLFGKGKISDLMGDVAKGIRSFKKGLEEDDQPASSEPKSIRDERSAKSAENDKDHHKSA